MENLYNNNDDVNAQDNYFIKININIYFDGKLLKSCIEAIKS